jgi:uncharacterized protein
VKNLSDIINQTRRTSLQRLPKRGNFERETIYEILDEGFVCYVGFTVDEQTFVIPTGYARVGDNLLIHGSAASRMLKVLRRGVDVCVLVTLLDGLVLARSAFHHSMNYRSVMIFGKASVIHGEQKKIAALRAFAEHVVPGRWSQVRPPNKRELKATTVLELPLQEASAKIRAGDPIDDDEDYALNVWAGVIPLHLAASAPVDDAKLKDDIVAPENVSNYNRRVKYRLKSVATNNPREQ